MDRRDRSIDETITRVAKAIPASWHGRDDTWRIRPRLKMDPQVSVAEIEKAISDWLDDQPMRDIYSLLRPLGENKPSTAPRAFLLADFATLFRRLAQVCTNAKLPPVKTETALRAIHAKNPIFFINKAVDECAEEVGKCIRVAFMKYREVFTNAETRRIVFSKAL